MAYKLLLPEFRNCINRIDNLTCHKTKRAGLYFRVFITYNTSWFNLLYRMSQNSQYDRPIGHNVIRLSQHLT